MYITPKPVNIFESLSGARRVGDPDRDKTLVIIGLTHTNACGNLAKLYNPIQPS